MANYLRDDGLDLEVENAPFVAGYAQGSTGMPLIRGMAAITKQIFNSDAVVTGRRAAVVGSGPCHFTLGLVRRRRSMTASLQVNTSNYDLHRSASLAIQLSFTCSSTCSFLPRV